MTHILTVYDLMQVFPYYILKNTYSPESAPRAMIYAK